ncbi:MAG: hypothetical protein N3A01_01840 [Bacteroidales bacterium]|nr:hypothetical protein [Bacteroidales bacterium]
MTFNKCIILILFLIVVGCCKFYENKYVSDPEDLHKIIPQYMYKQVNMNGHKYVFFVDSTHPYSYTISIPLKELKRKRYKSVTGKCEVYLFSLPSYINLVFEIRRNDNIIFWNSLSCDTVIKSILKWQEAEFFNQIPNVDTLLDNDIFKFYLWSVKYNPCYIGKMELIFR